MLDRPTLYNIIYALAACKGRDERLFGTGAPLAQEAFRRALVGKDFPELWFELPLMGEPWFDLHTLFSRESLDPTHAYTADETAGYPELFAWFSRQQDARQLALSYDVSVGDVENPAVQLLQWRKNVELNCDFLKMAGRADMQEAYRAFVGRIPAGWYPCYTGVFPRRADTTMHVECIPDRELQRQYAQDGALLEADLRAAGFTDLGDTLVPYCQQLAQKPFALEFQFDVQADGSLGSTLGASLRFEAGTLEQDFGTFALNTETENLMSMIEHWGLSDDRWRLMCDTAFTKRATFKGESIVLFNFPIFVKLRWRAGEPLDAKAYLQAGAQ